MVDSDGFVFLPVSPIAFLPSVLVTVLSVDVVVDSCLIVLDVCDACTGSVVIDAVVGDAVVVDAVVEDVIVVDVVCVE